jgi:hypothetical protein
MNKGRNIITVIAAVLVVAATGHADMRPVCPPDAGVQAARSCDQFNPLRDGRFSPFGPLGTPYTGPRSAGYPAEAQPYIGQTHQARPSRMLADERGSMGFCLYALLGLGLLKSAPYVKRLSLGVVPGWYHDGGPFQVGHSLAVSPDCLCSAPACFVQPDNATDDPPPQYCHEMIVSLWRKSQFTPTVLAPRGPPSIS